MDMLNILKNMDAAAAGDKPAVGANNKNSMKSILESIQRVEECGDTMEGGCMPGPQAPMQQGSPVSMNVSLNASGKDNVNDLISLMKAAGIQGAEEYEMPGTGDQDAEMDAMKLAIMGGDEEVEEAEWDNSPDEQYGDMSDAVPAGDDLHKKKRQFKASNPGDNAMAAESIKEQLWKALAEKKMSKKKM
jgi:hypothetical protein